MAHRKQEVFVATDPSIADKYVEAEGLKLHYLTAGQGEPVLLLHGWPTSAHLWRNIIVPLSRTKQVVALDLPGFGKSDKPLSDSYSFKFYERVLDSFVEKLGISRTTLVVHDLGGPVGLYWAVRHPEKIQRLALLNTVVYPELSWAAMLFVAATFAPLVKTWLVSSKGIEAAMRLGVENKQRLTRDVVSAYQAPFQDKDAQKVLLKSVQRLSPKGLKEIEAKLPLFRIPVRLIYGTNDRILPDVEKTMLRVKRALPQAQLTALPGCGHFLQEDEPEQVAELLGAFVNS
jgi:pimeloyl-ACP methyl ester carboxylesterase